MTTAQLLASAKTALVTKAKSQNDYRKANSSSKGPVAPQSLAEFKKSNGFDRLKISTVLGSGKSVLITPMKGNKEQETFAMAISSKMQETIGAGDSIVEGLIDGTYSFVTWVSADGEVVTNIGATAGVSEVVEC